MRLKNGLNIFEWVMDQNIKLLKKTKKQIFHARKEFFHASKAAQPEIVENKALLQYTK
jgi:hypothetical protein